MHTPFMGVLYLYTAGFLIAILLQGLLAEPELRDRNKLSRFFVCHNLAKREKTYKKSEYGKDL